MKSLKLQSFGVVEMNAEEMKESNGGAFWSVLWPIVSVYVLWEAAQNPKAHTDALKKGWNSVPHQF